MASSKNTAIFCEHGPKEWQVTSTGSLAGLRLAVKDLFAVKGEKNSAGNPDWFSLAQPAEQTSYAVEKLMQQGTNFVGFTQTDEIAYSLEGNNIHFGAAENPKLAGHACGGSSMGSAAAVAAGLAEIGLGTDTGGSVRVPASYCGLFGIRPSHGAIASSGLTPLAPAFDTTGWFCQSANLLEQVGEVLLPSQPVKKVKELVVFDALFDLVEPTLAAKLNTSLEQIKPQFECVRQFECNDKTILSRLADTFRILQGREIAKTHGEWVTGSKPTFSPAIQQRFDMALRLTFAEERSAKEIQQNWCEILAQNLSDDSVLFLPTAPSIAPLLGADTSGLRMQILTLTALAGLSGSAQVHLPLINTKYKGQTAPYGFSLLMKAGNDRTLLGLVTSITNRLRQQNEVT